MHPQTKAEAYESYEWYDGTNRTHEHGNYYDADFQQSSNVTEQLCATAYEEPEDFSQEERWTLT